MRLTFRSSVDPKLLAVNKRFRDNSVLPPEVRKAKKELAEEAGFQMIGQNRGWKQRSSDYYIVAIDFFMTDFRTDTDGPLKRAMDAIFEGAGLSDSRVQEIYLRRFQATTPGIDVDITQCRKGDYDVRDYRRAGVEARAAPVEVAPAHDPGAVYGAEDF